MIQMVTVLTCFVSQLNLLCIYYNSFFFYFDKFILGKSYVFLPSGSGAISVCLLYFTFLPKLIS